MLAMFWVRPEQWPQIRQSTVTQKSMKKCWLHLGLNLNSDHKKGRARLHTACLTMINVFSAASHEGQEQNFSVHAPEASLA